MNRSIEISSQSSLAANPPRRHAARLRHYWRSRGWACHDTIDIDLLAWGLIREIPDTRAASRFTLTDAGRVALGAGLARNRRGRAPHARIVDGVVSYLAGQGRLVFTELATHTDSEAGWQPCRPDVFSLVRSLRGDHLAAQIHEVKVNRADLLGELRLGKTAKYRELAGEIFLVLKDGIAQAQEIPDDYGVAFWSEAAGYRIERAAPVHDYRLEIRHWMAMARATPVQTDSEPLAQLEF